MKRILYVISISLVLAAAASTAHAEDTTDLTVLLACTGSCRPTSTQVVIPSDTFITLPQAVTIPLIEPGLAANDTPESVRAFVLRSQAPTAVVTTTTTSFDLKPLYAWAKKTLANFNQTVQEPKLVIQNNTVTEFTPPEDGIQIDIQTTIQAIMNAKLQNNKEVSITTHRVTPKTTLADTNTLGITEIIGRGESNFKGSPKNRIHNIQTGVAKLTNVLVKPNEEFSFNKNICPVDKEGGYLPELVIKGNEGTIPEYGGGLCQVSSTVYRAAMHAGLQITMRKNHSYAVQYYAPQGSDATTYCGGIDFRFKNDTTSYILIYPHFEGTSGLVFDLYGTKDGRTVTLEGPVQYDRKSDGSLKATWTRTVTKDNVSNTEAFKSVYLPPALFHKTEELTPTPTPAPITIPPAPEPSPVTTTSPL